MSIPITIFNKFKRDLGLAFTNVEIDEIWFYLTDATPDVNTNETPDDLVPLAATNGYADYKLLSQDWDDGATGIWKLTTEDTPTWTASGGVIGPFRYIGIYAHLVGSEDFTGDTLIVSAGDKLLIGYIDLGEEKIIDDGDSYAPELTDGLVFNIHSTGLGKITFFNQFKRNFGRARFQFPNTGFSIAGHTLKAYLTDATPDVDAHVLKSDLAEIASAGYGGPITLDYTWAEKAVDSGVWWLKNAAHLLFPASGGSVGPWRYAVIYDPDNEDLLIGYFDKGEETTTADGGTATVELTSLHKVIFAFTHTT